MAGGYRKGMQRLNIINGEIIPIEFQSCVKCNETKHHSAFSKRKNSPKNYSWCRQCVNANSHSWRKERGGKLKERERHLRKAFGITNSEYETMVIQQNNLCAICKEPESYKHQLTDSPCKLAIDHDHATGKVRQLLCRRCNQILGQFNDNVDLFKACIDYLNKHKFMPES